MQKLSIPYLVKQHGVAMAETSRQLDQLARHSLDHVLWNKPQILPLTTFAIAYDDAHIYLKFYVDEPYIKAEHRAINAPVYLDSCVEFFVAFGDDERYYNLEFNCAGTCLGQYGPDKASRNNLPIDVLKKIETASQIKPSDHAGLHRWELAITIPNAVFIHHNLHGDRPEQLRLNFYKCGDGLPEPHYLAWNEPICDEPNFHLPKCFGVGYSEIN